MALKVIVFFIICCFVPVMVNAHAEAIYTKDGETINAKIVSKTPNTIWYETKTSSVNGRLGISVDRVSRILNDDGSVSDYSPDKSVEIAAASSMELNTAEAGQKIKEEMEQAGSVMGEAMGEFFSGMVESMTKPTQRPEGAGEFSPNLTYDQTGPAAVYLEQIKKIYNCKDGTEFLEISKQYSTKETAEKTDAQINNIPPEQKTAALNVMFNMGTAMLPLPADIESIQENVNGDEATVTVTAKTCTGNISMVKEEGLWKITKEDYKATGNTFLNKDMSGVTAKLDDAFGKAEETAAE